MDTTNIRTPERILIIGCTSFAGLDSIAWTDQVVPNIPDYDLIVVSVPHITEDFLSAVKDQFLQDMRRALVRFLHSGGKMIILTSRHITVKRPSRYPEHVSTSDWCPISYGTPDEVGKSIIWRSQAYSSYLKKMTEWSFYLTIPKGCLTDELTNFYGSTYQTRYEVPLQAYLENRYSRVLAGQCLIEVRKERRRGDGWGNVHNEYPNEPDHVTGTIVVLPLIDGVSPEEALLDILKEEVGYSLKSPAPDWAQEIELPFVSELQDQIVSAQATIAKEEQDISTIVEKIDNLTAFRRLLYSSGTELEDVVKKSFELLGATVKPAKYSQEEYILEVDNDEFLMEVKGVSKSISLTHLRQLNDYLLKYQEDTGKECKGILLGNAWRNMPPAMRNAEDTPVFPDNVVKRAEQWKISLVSSLTLFDAVLKVLGEEAKAKDILASITTAEGVAHI
jgi:hypothetical protein